MNRKEKKELLRGVTIGKDETSTLSPLDQVSMVYIDMTRVHTHTPSPIYSIVTVTHLYYSHSGGSHCLGGTRPNISRANGPRTERV